WVNLTQVDWSGLEIVRAEIPCITVAGDPGTPADWATATTWDINPATPNSTHTAYVRHTVNVAAASGPQTVAGMFLDNANSDLRIESGASLTAGTTGVSNGSLLATGALNGDLNVSGGSVTIAGASPSTIGTLTASGGTTSVAGGTVTTLNTSATGTAVSGGSVTTVKVTAGTASLSGGTIGTVTASGGTTTLGTSVTALNANSGSAIVVGAGGGAGTAVVKTGSSIDASANYMAIGTSLTMKDNTVIAVSGATVDVKGTDVGAQATVSKLKLNGGTVSMSGPAASSGVSVVATKAPAGWMGAGSGTLGGVSFSAGADGMLVATVTGEMNTVGSVTWTPTGGTAQAMTQAAQGTGSTSSAAVFYLANPGVTDGTGAVSYTTAGGNRAAVGAIYATGVASLEASAQANNPNVQTLSAGPITASAGALLVDAGGHSNTGPFSAGGIVSGGDTVLYNIPGAGSCGAASYKISAGGSESATWTMTGGAQSESVAIASFAPAIRPPFSISMSSADVELAANTTLNIGVAASAIFNDLVLATGNTSNTTLRIQGSNAAAVAGLANYFDLTAPNAGNVYNIGSGADYIDLEVRVYVPTWHAGDVNQDGQVSLLDYNVIKANFGNTYASGNHWTDGDVNGDLQVGLLDFNIVKAHFGHTTGDVGVTAVPEPATLSLLALAGLAALRRKR
ncbi:MAG: dockerin type I domain-containing protein, partial [Planctomycetota bacterium]|nr:dockerin type I domain-containing protein [Planctomycetota bacterium]